MFDPMNFTKGARVKDVRRWRESELVHGRVAMLAALGFIVGEQLEDFPAFYNADGHITGPAIYQFQQVEARGAIFVSIHTSCRQCAETCVCRHLGGQRFDQSPQHCPGVSRLYSASSCPPRASSRGDLTNQHQPSTTNTDPFLHPCRPCRPRCSLTQQWEPLILAIGLAESYRVGLGWSTPVGEGFNSVKDEYELGNLG